MIVYALFLISVYFFSRENLFSVKGNRRKVRAALVGIAIWLLMGFRHQTVAGDTVMYVYKFQYQSIYWPGLQFFFLNQKEPLFYLLEFILQKFTRSYTIYLFATSALLVYGFSRLLKAYSEDMFLSVLLFCGIGSMYFCMAGLRQAIAMGCTMIAYPYAEQRKLKPFLFWCLIAFGFHNSSIVFAFTYFLLYFKPNWQLWIVVAISAYLGLTRNPIVMIVANLFTTKDYVMDEQGLNYTLFFIQLIFCIFCYVFRFVRDGDKTQREYDSWLLLSFVGLCFQAFTPIKGEFFRVSSYFSVFLCLAVPKALRNSRWHGLKPVANAVMVCGLLGYIFIWGSASSYMTCFA